MKVAIITINYNGKKDTLELLASLKKFQISNFKFQIKTIVVDNASADGSVPEIHKRFPDVDILQTGSNLGFAGGYNKGIEYAKIWGADYYLLINNDCLIKGAGLIQELVSTAQKDKRIGFVSPKILFARGFEFHKDRYSKDDLGKVIWFAGGEFDWDNIASKHRGLDEVDDGQYDEIIESGIFSGACVLIKKEVLEGLGGLDEKYFLYFEDSDLAVRAKKAGFKIFYNGKTSIYHKVSQSTGIGSKVTDYYHTRNRLIFGMQYGKNRTKFALIREAIKLFIFGRPAQRQGVLDFYLKIFGGISENNQPVYPFKLSIGIVNYNTSDLAKKLLQSIFYDPSTSLRTSLEIIVLDNGNLDPCDSWIKDFPVKYLQNKENEGFSKGYNKTIKFSRGEYYLMLNSDIEVLPGSLEELIKVEDEYKGEAVLGGKLLFPDGSNQDSVFHLPTIWGAIKEYFLAKWGSYFMYTPKSLEKVEGMVMACLLIPKKILAKAGLLDEKTFIFFEDIEYARRLKKFNIPMYFVPSAKFIHYHGGSTQKIGQEKANEHLVKASKHYHGKFYYYLLTFVLKLGQKLGRVNTPISRWTRE